MKATGTLRAVIGSRAPAATPAPTRSPTPGLDALVAVDPDLVDRIFDYVVQLMPEIAARKAELKKALRHEFAGERSYVRQRDAEVDPLRRACFRCSTAATRPKWRAPWASGAPPSTAS
jgi:hypothetical protein